MKEFSPVEFSERSVIHFSTLRYRDNPEALLRDMADWIASTGAIVEIIHVYTTYETDLHDENIIYTAWHGHIVDVPTKD